VRRVCSPSKYDINASGYSDVPVDSDTSATFASDGLIGSRTSVSPTNGGNDTITAAIGKDVIMLRHRRDRKGEDESRGDHAHAISARTVAMMPVAQEFPDLKDSRIGEKEGA
jgi:hypothetical protein